MFTTFFMQPIALMVNREANLKKNGKLIIGIRKLFKESLFRLEQKNNY